MGRSKHFQIPESDNDFLSEILKALKKRSKSLNYNSWEIKIQKEFEHFEEGRLEKIVIEIQPSNINAKFRIEVWEDRFVHVNCWERTKSQKWDWEFDGRFLPNYSGVDFLAALESTRSKFFGMSELRIKEFESSWGHLVANGPQSVE